MNLFENSNDCIHLKPMELADAAYIHEYASSPNVKKYIGWPLMNHYQETEDFVKVMMDRHEAKTHVYASVVEDVSGKVIGTMMLFNLDEEAKHCEVGYVFHEAAWGKGYCTAATRWVTDYVFNEMGMRKIFARVVNVNVGSSKVLTNNGFSLEAILKDYYSIDQALMHCEYYSLYAPQISQRELVEA